MGCVVSRPAQQHSVYTESAGATAGFFADNAAKSACWHTRHLSTVAAVNCKLMLMTTNPAVGVTRVLCAAQVELNTIASSFACLSSITSQLHHYTLQRLAAASSSSSSDAAAAALQLLSASRLPSNAAMQGICRALAAAVVAAGGPGAVMVMVVQPGERNAYDQQVSRVSGFSIWGSVCT